MAHRYKTVFARPYYYQVRILCDLFNLLVRRSEKYLRVSIAEQLIQLVESTVGSSST